jgi:hypothetical protein
VLHHPFEAVEAVKMESQMVVFDGAPVLQVILGHDAESGVVDPRCSVYRLAVT